MKELGSLATHFVKTAKDFKLNSAKAKEFGITQQEFQDYIGGVTNLQKSYKGKDYNLINVEAAETYGKNIAELQAYLSSKFG